MTNFELPPDYIARSTINYFDDSTYLTADIVYQPEVYDIADYLIRATGRTTVIDIGCGSGRKLRAVNADRHIGIDFGSNIELCRSTYGAWGEWHEADFSRKDCLDLASFASSAAVVVCADVVEHVLDPRLLVDLLAACHARGAIVLTSTPDRVRVRGVNHKGPPPNRSHIREWAMEEYVRFLASRGLPAIFGGYTINNSRDRRLETILTIHDRQVDDAFSSLDGSEAAPLAIVSASSEREAKEAVDDLAREGCETVTVSSDDAANAVAAQHAERWIIQAGSGQFLRSPFRGKTLAQSLAVAGKLGATRVKFTDLEKSRCSEMAYFAHKEPAEFRYRFLSQHSPTPIDAAFWADHGSAVMTDLIDRRGARTDPELVETHAKGWISKLLRRTAR